MSNQFNLREYFKDKINWKLFNYLRDCCVLDEDEGGYITTLHVFVVFDGSREEKVLGYESDKKFYWMDENKYHSTAIKLNWIVSTYDDLYLSYHFDVIKWTSYNDYDSISRKRKNMIRDSVVRQFGVECLPEDGWKDIKIRHRI